jgi:hypothetical protein
MTASTWAAGSVVERAFTWRGHDRYAHLGLRVAVEAALRAADPTEEDAVLPPVRVRDVAGGGAWSRRRRARRTE